MVPTPGAPGPPARIVDRQGPVSPEHATLSGVSAFGRWYSARFWIPPVIDVVVVVAFAVIGRAAHRESLEIAGIVETVWPFAAALVLAWLVVLLTRGEGAHAWPEGTVIWAITLTSGIALRLAAGFSAAFAFIAVAALVLALGIIGPRLLVAALLRREAETARSARAPEAPDATTVEP